MKTVAIIQARMGSTRLPGKVLADLAGKPVLAWVVRAARAALGVDDVWVATSTAAADDAVAAWCKANGVSVHRGSEHDVLDRYAGAAKASGAADRRQAHGRLSAARSRGDRPDDPPPRNDRRRLRIQCRSADLAGWSRLRGADR